MAKRAQGSGGDLFIVDNSDKAWKARRYLHDWADIAHTFDIATGYFEIGALLALDGQWQKLEKLRILMGDTVSKRTRRALLDGVEAALDGSLEQEKETNDFLSGVPAIVEGLRRKQIQCRVYGKKKFHAKAYITHARQEVIGAAALVGSSNFTMPGLTENVELNIQIRREVEVLQQWFESYWDEAEDITEEVLKVVERHTREYSPFEVYAKALQEFFRGHELTASEWELSGPDNNGSHMYGVLDQYQREGYHALMKIARQYGGAFLCDGVGLGKTFIGLMLIERLVMYERKRVALFVPKAARKPVWGKELNRYLPHLHGDFSNLVIFNHTDLLRERGYQERLNRVAELADVFVIDEAHHFRNPGQRLLKTGKPSRYWRFFEIAEGKPLFLLTATPINNRLLDLQHMIELFSRREPGYFRNAPLGIHSLSGHFRTMEKELERIVVEKELGEPGVQTNQAEAEQVLLDDDLFRALVEQRSRAYVKASQALHGGKETIFPEREPPKVAKYSIKKTYGGLLAMIEKAFSKEKPLFSLALYYPLAYYIGPDMGKQQRAFEENRQKQVVSLIRTQFLKRFESSVRAFEMSCATLFFKLLAFVKRHSEKPGEKRWLERWEARHEELIGHLRDRQHQLLEDTEAEEMDEDVISEEMLEAVEELPRDEYRVEEILVETQQDLDQLVEFLQELGRFKPAHDDKLRALIRLLKSDAVLKKHKVLIFSEFMATARYVKQELTAAGIDGVDEVDSGDKRDRGDVICRFSPYYNRSSSSDVTDGIRVLVSTDVLSEGLNLQDATRVINYDIHWNPVRLMQRIGRVDRRLNSEIEQRILEDHPEQKDIRQTVAYWNFLPPDELDVLLRLYRTVSHKVLRISKVFGIEGKKLLRPEDDFDALKDFDHKYEGTVTPTEEMHLEFQRLLQEHPELEERLKLLPGRVFSGKQHPSPEAKAVFFCFALPAPDLSRTDDEEAAGNVWTEEAGYTGWYLYDIASGSILDDASAIVGIIRSTPETPRHRAIPDKTLSEIRATVEKHVKDTYLKRVQAPIGVKATLKAWMELS